LPAATGSSHDTAAFAVFQEEAIHAKNSATEGDSGHVRREALQASLPEREVPSDLDLPKGFRKFLQWVLIEP